MEQIPLKIKTKLLYSFDNFFLHSGIRDAVLQCLELIKLEKFSITFFNGNKKSGKTHLSIYLAYTLLELGYYPKIIEGKSFKRWIGINSGIRRDSSKEVIIIDDADQYFSDVYAGSSGEFVNLYEIFRLSKGSMVFLSSLEVKKFPSDDHIKSRLNSGAGFYLGSPSEEDFMQLTMFMAKQRGINLSPKKASYLIYRIGRSISDIDDYLDRVTYLTDITTKNINYQVLSVAVERKELR